MAKRFPVPFWVMLGDRPNRQTGAGKLVSAIWGNDEALRDKCIEAGKEAERARRQAAARAAAAAFAASTASAAAATADANEIQI